MQVDAPRRHQLIMAQRSYVFRYISEAANRTPVREATLKGKGVGARVSTVRLRSALREHRHLRAARVLCQRDSSPLTQKIVQDHVRRAARRAQLSKSGVYRLRHTFCSHLAMREAPARAIQELLAISEPGEIG